MNKPWSYTTRTLVAVAGAIGLVWLIVAASPLITSLIVAALLAYLLDPTVQLLVRRTRLNRLWAARLVYIAFIMILGGIPALLSTVALSQFDRLETDFLEAIVQLRQWLTQPLSIFGFQFQPLALLDNLEQTADNALSMLPGGAIDALATVTTNFLWGLTALVGLYYFLVDGPKIKPWLLGLLPPDYWQEAQLLLEEIDNAWRIFLRAQLLIFVILAALVLTSTLLIVWLYRSGLLPLSPIGLIILLVIVYTLIQQVDNVWLRPWFFGERLKLHPGVVFVGLIGALALSGILGVIIVVPCIATAKIIGRYLHCRLLGLPPWPHLETSPAEAGTAAASFADQTEATERQQSMVASETLQGTEQTSG